MRNARANGNRTFRQTMKLNHRATLSILALAVVSSVGSIGLAGLQLQPQHAATDVVINTAIVRGTQRRS